MTCIDCSLLKEKITKLEAQRDTLLEVVADLMSRSGALVIKTPATLAPSPAPSPFKKSTCSINYTQEPLINSTLKDSDPDVIILNDEYIKPLSKPLIPPSIKKKTLVTTPKIIPTLPNSQFQIANQETSLEASDFATLIINLSDLNSLDNLLHKCMKQLLKDSLNTTLLHQITTNTHKKITTPRAPDSYSNTHVIPETNILSNKISTAELNLVTFLYNLKTLAPTQYQNLINKLNFGLLTEIKRPYYVQHSRSTRTLISLYKLESDAQSIKNIIVDLLNQVDFKKDSIVSINHLFTIIANVNHIWPELFNIDCILWKSIIACLNVLNVNVDSSITLYIPVFKPIDLKSFLQKLVDDYVLGIYELKPVLETKSAIQIVSRVGGWELGYSVIQSVYPMLSDFTKTECIVSLIVSIARNGNDVTECKENVVVIIQDFVKNMMTCGDFEIECCLAQAVIDLAVGPMLFVYCAPVLKWFQKRDVKKMPKRLSQEVACLKELIQQSN